MSVTRLATILVLLRTSRCQCRRTRLDGTLRPIPFRVSDVRITSHGKDIQHRQIESNAVDASASSRCNVSETKNDVAESWTQKVSVFAARYRAELSESHLVDRHHLHRFEPRIRVSNGNHRLVQPNDFGVAIIEYNGCQLLRWLPWWGVGSLRRAGVF